MTTHTETYHVDAQTDYAGDGSRRNPFATIQHAADNMEPGDRCVIHAGTYRETVAPPRSGTTDAPMVFESAGDGPVVVNGCDPVNGWKKHDGRVYRASVTLDLEHGNQIFADGTMMHQARWPKIGAAHPRSLLEFDTATMGEGTTPTRIVDPDLPDWDWSGATAWVSSQKRWYSWTGKVTGFGADYVDIENNANPEGPQECVEDGKYYLFGVRDALTEQNEWYYDDDEQTLYVWMPDGDAPEQRIEAKRRQLAFDLRGRSHIILRNLHVHAATVQTDETSENLEFDGLNMKYVHHSMRAEDQYGSQRRSGLILRGSGHLVKNSEIAFSSGSCLTLDGYNCRIVNNHIHDGNYIGSYAAPLLLARGSRGHLISHNTIERAGRSVVSTQGLYDCLMQHNELCHAGYLTADLGLTYGNGVEGGNSEIRYNVLHHNHAPDHNAGLYFDHGCKNLIIHHNFIHHVDGHGLQNNQYANYILYYNNTVADAEVSYRSCWAAAQPKDLYGCQLVNNLGTGTIEVDGKGLHRSHNTWNCDTLRNGVPPRDSKSADGGTEIPRVTDGYSGAAPHRGAFETGQSRWCAGHDFEKPPIDIDVSRALPPHRNRLHNAAFHRGRLDGWQAEGPSVDIIHEHNSQWITDSEVRMGGYSVRLGPGQNAISQVVKGLEPETTYEMMAMFRVEDAAEARLEVSKPDGSTVHSASVSGNAPDWNRQRLQFQTDEEGPVTVYITKVSDGPGCAWIDDPGLQIR